MKITNNFLKILLSSMLTLDFYGCSKLQIKQDLTDKCNPFAKFNIPERFKDYKSKKIVSGGIAPLKLGIDYIINFDSYSYDVDGDGIRDVGELYLPGTKIKGKNPLIYGFNIHNQLVGKQEFDWFLIDVNLNGLNCDEEPAPQILEDGRLINFLKGDYLPVYDKYNRLYLEGKINYDLKTNLE